MLCQMCACVQLQHFLVWEQYTIVGLHLSFVVSIILGDEVPVGLKDIVQLLECGPCDVKDMLLQVEILGNSGDWYLIW